MQRPFRREGRECILPAGARPEVAMSCRIPSLSVLALAAMLGLIWPATAQERAVNVYNWTDYIDPAAIERFQKETGTEVRYDVYDSLETLEGKLLAGSSGYDVVVPTSEPTFSRLIKVGALQPIDWKRVPNRAGLDPTLMQRVASSDPGNRYGAIYLWGTIGLGIIPDRVRAQAPDAAMDSWNLLFRPENARRIAACGITMMDSAIDVIPSVLKYLGRDPGSTDPADLQSVETLLMSIRPYIRTFASGGAVNALAAGETCLVMSYSGDVIQAAARAEEAGRGVSVQYVAPKEGAQLWFDMLAIPKDAPHPDAALAFINFVLQPQVIAGITNQVRYPNAVPASRPFVRPALLDDPNIYPQPDRIASFFTIGPVPQAAERARNRMWARFKAGN
jgi:putrescine transport system substrate-binding protein